MSELQHLLATTACDREPTDLPPFDAVRARARQWARRRTVAETVGLLTVVLVTVLVAVAVLRPAPVPTATSETSRSYLSEWLSFQYPEGWNVYRSGGLPDGQHGDGSMLKVSTEDTPFPCALVTEGRWHVSCSVDASLAAGGVLITWVWEPSVSPAPGPSRGRSPTAEATLDAQPGQMAALGGWPARVEEGQAGRACGDVGAAHELRASVLVGRDDRARLLIVTACLAAPFDQTRHQVLTLLDSVVLTG